MAGRKKAAPTDDELRQEIRDIVIERMRGATAIDYVEVTCRECGQRQKAQALVPDRGASLRAATELWDRIEGKAATKKDAPKVKLSGRPLEELSDEELEAMIAGGSDGEVVGGGSEEAA